MRKKTKSKSHWEADRGYLFWYLKTPRAWHTVSLSFSDCWPTDGADAVRRATASHEALLPARKALSTYLVTISQSPERHLALAPVFRAEEPRPTEN